MPRREKALGKKKCGTLPEAVGTKTFEALQLGIREVKPLAEKHVESERLSTPLEAAGERPTKGR